MIAPAVKAREPAHAPAVALRSRACALGVAAMLALGLTAPASAQPATEPVTIAIASCGAAEARAALTHQVEVELRVAGITVVDAVSAPDDATHVTIVPQGCHPGQGAALVVRAPGRPPLRRALELTADGADRVLALALVDALRRAWARPREDEAQAVTAEQLASARAEAQRERAALREAMETRLAVLGAEDAEEDAERRRETIARRALPAWDLLGGAALLGYLEGGAALLGGTLGAGLTLLDPLRLALEVTGGYGLARDPLGEVGLASFGGVLALELHARAAPLAGWVGAWAGVGYGRAEGRPADGAAGAALEGATGALGLRAGAALELSASWSVFARLDGGYGWGGVAANAAAMRRVAALRGVILTLAIGVRAHP